MRNGNFAYRFIGLVTGVALLAGIGLMAHANDARIPVGPVHGETLWLDDGIRQAARLPNEFRTPPLGA